MAFFLMGYKVLKQLSLECISRSENVCVFVYQSKEYEIKAPLKGFLIPGCKYWRNARII